MWDWKQTAKIYLEYLFFMVGAYGPVYFTLLYGDLIGFAGTSLCWMLLYFFYKKL
ncbi:hypothetical protein [Brevibacillus reuszeri]|uniref:hypothetical protein n=1 Tax=Brevibacillus reuszeri TaxID=54915 RepID=UPI0013DE9A29|nr:hypothetical protein [Brevibacillus reuszeri]